MRRSRLFLIATAIAVCKSMFCKEASTLRASRSSIIEALISSTSKATGVLAQPKNIKNMQRENIFATLS